MNFVEESMKTLNDHGYKYTRRRADMLSVFDEDQEHFLTAKVVQQRLNQRYPGMSFDTIYRNLKLFEDYHLLESSEVNGEMVFRKHCDPQIGHHHHFICTNCGRTVSLDMCPLDYFEAQLPGFEIKNHKFELQGLCDRCAKKA